MPVYVAFCEGGENDEIVCYAGLSLEKAIASKPKYRIEVWQDDDYVQMLSREGVPLPSMHV